MIIYRVIILNYRFRYPRTMPVCSARIYLAEDPTTENDESGYWRLEYDEYRTEPERMLDLADSDSGDS